MAYSGDCPRITERKLDSGRIIFAAASHSRTDVTPIFPSRLALEEDAIRSAPPINKKPGNLAGLLDHFYDIGRSVRVSPSAEAELL